MAGQIQLVPPIDQSLVSRLLLRLQHDDGGNAGDGTEMPGMLSAELAERKEWCWWWCE